MEYSACSKSNKLVNPAIEQCFFFLSIYSGYYNPIHLLVLISMVLIQIGYLLFVCTVLPPSENTGADGLTVITWPHS